MSDELGHTVEQKNCTGCLTTKPVSEFYRDSVNPDRTRSKCKLCWGAQSRNWTKANPDRHKRIYRRTNHRANLRRRFNLTVEQFDSLWAACDGKCGICLEPETRGRRLSLDHDHKTGRLRGFLCSQCNLLLGVAKDDPRRLVRAANYLQTARLTT